MRHESDFALHADALWHSHRPLLLAKLAEARRAGWYGPPLIEPGRLTVPAMLREHGYATACFGKWHLGMDGRRKDGAPLAAGAEANLEKQSIFPSDRQWPADARV